MFAEEKQRSQDIASDMTRQYKSTAAELEARLASLDTAYLRHTADIEHLRRERHALEAETAQLAAAKDSELNELKKQMDKLQGDFGAMLADTLTKIKAKIQAANNNDWNAAAGEEKEDNALLLKAVESVALL